MHNTTQRQMDESMTKPGGRQKMKLVCLRFNVFSFKNALLLLPKEYNDAFLPGVLSGKMLVNLHLYFYGKTYHNHHAAEQD